MSAYRAIPGLATETYQSHNLHSDQRVWIEKNCYVDVWIEVLNALQMEPTAVMPFALAVDFEGDHWTFFKPPLTDLRSLYGIDVQELNLWRPLIEHAVEYLGDGKLLSTEADAFWLPDTSGTDYQRQHTKTTIVLNAVDVDNQRAGYFHNAGYFTLEGEDFRQLFRIGAQQDPFVPPPYAELIRFDRGVARAGGELASASYRLLREHFQYRPRTNPIQRFAQRFGRDLPSLLVRGLPHYHAWAFGTLRQLGAAFELVAACLRWQSQLGCPSPLRAAEHFDSIAQDTKALILRVARAVNSGRSIDLAPAFEKMAQDWDAGMGALADALDS